MPLFHIGGIGTALASLYFGAKMVILRDFEPDLVLDHIERDVIKKLFLVPAAFRILLDHPRTKSCDFSRLEHILYGSSPITTALLEEAIAVRSEEHTSELQSLMRISYAVFCLKKKKHIYLHTP